MLIICEQSLMCSPYPALDVLEYLFNLLETFGPAMARL